MPTSWKEMSVGNLRDIARSYRNLHSLGNISKQTKATLIETLSKVMEWNDGDIYTKKEHGGKFVGAYDEDDKKIGLTNFKRPQPENKKKEAQPKKAEQPKQKKAEQPKQKKEDDAKKKSVEKAISQAKSASEDAKKIAPPSQRRVEAVMKSQIIGEKARPQAKSARDDAKAIAPPSKKEDDAKKEVDFRTLVTLKARNQAVSASRDAKKIAPPPSQKEELKKQIREKARGQAIFARIDAEKIAPPIDQISYQIQQLPPELQNEIFKKLPDRLQGQALGKTDEDMGAEFIKKRLPKAEFKTRENVRDFIYDLMDADAEFQDEHYEDLDERSNNTFEYEFADVSRMSENRIMKEFDRVNEMIFREKMREYRKILLQGRKEKASPSVIRARLIAMEQ